jgi:hypothetical protein
MVGELCIGGAGVADGYHRQPELTAARFVPDALLGRYYRTGDRARWLPDGTLELLGRLDRQIKLRGHRIELNEVEGVLEAHPAVSAAAVLVDRDPAADSVLTAFVVAGECAGLADELWAHAANTLPGYSLPARITVLDRLPTTGSGKVDYRQLRRMSDTGWQTPAAANSPVAPEPVNHVEAELVRLWQTVLGRSGLDRYANFFLSGGHSLLAVRLAKEASARFEVPLTMAMIFRAPTPAALAKLVQSIGS